MGPAWRNRDIDRIRNEYRSWAEETFPGGLERDRIGDSYSAVAWKTLAAKGFFGMCIPTELGGDGLYDWPAQQALRDAIPATIWAGTSETLRNTIAKLEGLPVD